MKVIRVNPSYVIKCLKTSKRISEVLRDFQKTCIDKNGKNLKS